MGVPTDVLRSIVETLELTDPEVADMFGVTDGEINKWLLNDDMPYVHIPKLAVVVKITDILLYRLKEGVLPDVCRRPGGAVGWDNKSILELIAEGRHEFVLSDIIESFDYSTVA